MQFLTLCGRYFSAACANDTSRQTFATNVAAAYSSFNLDGIDIDWEYPGRQGAGSNGVSPADSANLLAFLQLLRATLPSSARITAAVADTPFTGPDGQPMNNVSAYAQVLDWVLLMNYDTWGCMCCCFHATPNAER